MELSTRNMRMLSHLGQRGAVCVTALEEIAEECDNLFVLTADMAQLSALERFEKKNNDKFVNTGISEQNMIGVASGLAYEGNNVFVTTYATFLTMRCYEQIRHNLGYHNANVKLIGFSAGVVMGMSGNSHYAIEDISIMRSIPRMIVLSPADPVEAYKMMHFLKEYDGPAYLRLTGGLNQRIVTQSNDNYLLGKGTILKSGVDVAIIATGTMVFEALLASKILEENNIESTVINMSTIKPLDCELVEKCLDKKLIVTAEEHSVIGGLGSAVAEYLSLHDRHPKLLRIGINDEFIHPGSYEWILQKYGLNSSDIAARIREEIGKIVR